MTDSPRIAIVGAGPGGLTAAMELAHSGFDVHVFEKRSIPGGRNGYIQQGPYRHDIGPTFLMMKFVLEEVFKECGKDVNDYMELVRLSPMYRLDFKEGHVDMYDEPEKTKASMAKLFPKADVEGYDRFYKTEKWRFDRMYPCLTRNYSSPLSLGNPDLLKAWRALSFNKSLYNRLGDYFKDPKTRISFTFQSKYLGMSPWECPGAFAMIPYVEHAFGIYHVQGGLSEISAGMARAAQDDGAKIHYNTPVKRLLLNGKKCIGVELEDGRKFRADEVIINADFAHAMNKLIPKGKLKKFTPGKLRKKKYSVSTFMIYMGLDKQYDLEHHTVVFAKRYKKNLASISSGKIPWNNASFYVRDASQTDPNIAPPGHSALYVLVPVPNRKAKINWQRDKTRLRNWVIGQMKERLDMHDIEEHIVEEMLITPDEWEKDYDVYLGATFNLGHNFSQMLYFRPHNKFEELKNVYLTGGGTHPGSGLPTIYESGRISAALICKKHGKACGRKIHG